QTKNGLSDRFRICSGETERCSGDIRRPAARLSAVAWKPWLDPSEGGERDQPPARRSRWIPAGRARWWRSGMKPFWRSHRRLRFAAVAVALVLAIWQVGSVLAQAL